MCTLYIWTRRQAYYITLNKEAGLAILNRELVGEQSQAETSWRRKLWLIVSTYTVHIHTEIRSFCHSHGCEALGFLTRPCSCQRHTFTQGFLGPPHFLSVQALIPIPLCYFTLERCAVLNYRSWKSIFRNPLYGSEIDLAKRGIYAEVGRWKQRSSHCSRRWQKERMASAQFMLTASCIVAQPPKPLTNSVLWPIQGCLTTNLQEQQS